MPAKGKSRITAAQRAKIAVGKVSGKTRKQIAKETGLHPDTVGRQASDQRTVTIIQGWKNRQRRQIDQALDLTLRSLLRDLRSKDNDLVRDARRDTMRIATIGDPPLYRVGEIGGDAGDGITYEELLGTIRRMELRTAADRTH